jgi:hypothetical protein
MLCSRFSFFALRIRVESEGRAVVSFWFVDSEFR